ncbi:hypothetical protein H0H92_002471 [Tricholoma furcatifolium]|nr:hypothetical protein H0H92_002471 [Tricholoma furcatifolium]
MYSLKRTPVFLGIAGLIVAIALMQCITALVNGIQVFLVGAAGADVLIALAMTFVLYARKSPDMLARTNQLLDKLIVQVVHSGAITAVVAIVELICFHLKPETYLHICLYSNVLMANLNSRRKPSHSATNSRAYYDTNESIGTNNNMNVLLTGGFSTLPHFGGPTEIWK